VLERVRAGDHTPSEMVPHIYAGTGAFFPLAEASVLSMLIMHEEDGLVRQTDDGAWLPAR